MLKNYRSWVHFARDRLGRDITVKDVVLVTGRDLTNQWATATFVERHRDAGISFQVGDGFGSRHLSCVCLHQDRQTLGCSSLGVSCITTILRVTDCAFLAGWARCIVPKSCRDQ